MMPERSKTVAYGLKADLTSLEYFKVFGHLADTLDEISRGVKGGDNVEERWVGGWVGGWVSLAIITQ
jgi:hypothetical protein